MSNDKVPQLELPFVMSVVGCRKSGKSYKIKQFLEQDLIHRFHYIIILCPSIHLNDDYTFLDDYYGVYKFDSNLKEVMKEVIDTMTHIKMMNKKSTPQVLFILDDCLNSKVMNFHSPYEIIASRGRHFNVSMILTSQKLKGISTTVRKNSDYMCLFQTSNYSELESLIEEMCSKKYRKQLQQKAIDILNERYSFIFIDNLQTLCDRMRSGFYDIIKFNQ